MDLRERGVPASFQSALTGALNLTPAPWTHQPRRYVASSMPACQFPPQENFKLGRVMFAVRRGRPG